MIRGGLAARLTSLVLGLFLCSCGIVAFLEAGLGLPPWDVLHQGIADQTPLSFGEANLLVSVVVAILIHFSHGSTASGGPAGVGLAVGRAVRTSIVAINVIDLFLSMAIWGTTTTVRLAG